jgi:hypothetical protein
MCGKILQTFYRFVGQGMNNPTAQPTNLTAEQHDGLVRAYQRIIAYLAQHRPERREQHLKMTTAAAPTTPTNTLTS